MHREDDDSQDDFYDDLDFAFDQDYYDYYDDVDEGDLVLEDEAKETSKPIVSLMDLVGIQGRDKRKGTFLTFKIH